MVVVAAAHGGWRGGGGWRAVRAALADGAAGARRGAALADFAAGPWLGSGESGRASRFVARWPLAQG